MTEAERTERLANILRITPEDQDPVIYWHQVAIDAINSADGERKRTQDIRNENYRLTRMERTAQDRERRELVSRTMPSVRELLGRVQDGDFSMNIQFSFYPNTERKEGGINEDYED